MIKLRRLCLQADIFQSKETENEYIQTYQLVIKSQPLSEDARTFLQPNQTFEKGIFSTLLLEMVAVEYVFNTFQRFKCIQQFSKTCQTL